MVGIDTFDGFPGFANENRTGKAAEAVDRGFSFGDVDIYEPTRAALKHFVPRMPKGAIIVFDQLNSSLWPGESIALHDELGVGNFRIERFSWDSYLSYIVL